MSLVTSILAAYAITFVLASSRIAAPWRAWVAGIRLKMLLEAWLVSWEPDDEGEDTGSYAHPFERCRMCVGFWVSCIVALCAGCSFLEMLAVYGGSYFLATQER